MPYIKEEQREALERSGVSSLPTYIADAGTLNYLITRLVINYVKSHYLSYETINSVMGALEGAKAEFYRRVAAPYEDTKIAVNGEVYPPELLSSDWDRLRSIGYRNSTRSLIANKEPWNMGDAYISPAPQQPPMDYQRPDRLDILAAEGNTSDLPADDLAVVRAMP